MSGPRDRVFYDRAVPEPLGRLLLPGSALGWLPRLLRDDQEKLALSDLQLRRNPLTQPFGALHLYIGSSRVLEVRGGRPGTRGGVPSFTLTVAAEAYRKYWGELPSGPLDEAELAALAPALGAYLDQVSGQVGTRWTTLESKVHAGVMRTYGLHAGSTTPFLAFDREVTIGNRDKDSRQAAGARIGERSGRPEGRVPAELDVLALLPDGTLGLVELKAGVDGLSDAASQLRGYVARFEELLREADGLPAIVRLVEQKVKVGLLPAGHPGIGHLAKTKGVVPIIALPDEQPGDWATRWREVLKRQGYDVHLPGLQLWRLSEAGTRLEEELAFP